MNRILLLLDQKENRRLLDEFLPKDRYDVLHSANARSLDTRFDLAVVDALCLSRIRTEIEARKEAEKKVFLPFLLIASRRDLGLAQKELWRTIDELILMPVKKVELLARVEVLLRARTLALNLKERKEKQLQRKEHLLRLFVEHSPAAIAMFDHRMKYLVASRRFLTDYNLGDQHIVGRSHYEVFPEIPERWREIHRRCLAGAVEKCEEDSFLRSDGKTDWVRWEICPWYSTEGEIGGIILFSEVITERKTMEMHLKKHREHLEELVQERTAELQEKTSELQAANERLREIDRLKSVFTASMSHELRTPLNSIIGFTGVMLMGLVGPLTDEQSKQLTIVKNSANHLLSLISDILDISKIESGKVEISVRAFDLGTLASEVVETLAPAAREKGLNLVTRIPEDMVMRSDRRRVMQILMNLAGNAVKFTDEGQVSIEAGLLGDGRVAIQVTDTGIGIKKEQMGKLFSAFLQLDESLTKKYAGTGLGLYLSKKLAHLLGGDLEAQSEYGKGSRFTVVLPVSYEEVGRHEEDPGD